MAAPPIAYVVKKWFHVDVIKMFESSIIILSRQGSEGSLPLIDGISSYRLAGVKNKTIDGSLHREEQTRAYCLRKKPTNEQLKEQHIQKGAEKSDSLQRCADPPPLSFGAFLPIRQCWGVKQAPSHTAVG